MTPDHIWVKILYFFADASCSRDIVEGEEDTQISLDREYFATSFELPAYHLDLIAHTLEESTDRLDMGLCAPDKSRIIREHQDFLWSVSDRRSDDLKPSLIRKLMCQRKCLIRERLVSLIRESAYELADRRDKRLRTQVSQRCIRKDQRFESSLCTGDRRCPSARSLERNETKSLKASRRHQDKIYFLHESQDIVFVLMSEVDDLWKGREVDARDRALSRIQKPRLHRKSIKKRICHRAVCNDDELDLGECLWKIAPDELDRIDEYIKSFFALMPTSKEKAIHMIYLCERYLVG